MTDPRESRRRSRGKRETLDDHVGHIAAVLDAAGKLREEALARLTRKDRLVLFDRVPALVREFGSQAALTDKTRTRLEADRAFCTVWEEKIDCPAFAASVRTLLLLADPGYLGELRAAMA